MPAPDRCVILYCTAETRDEALAVSRALVAERLAACANILGPITSVYEWQGEAVESSEVSFIIKTSAEKSKAAIERIAALHSYDCPCVVTLNGEGGHEPFLSWIRQQTGPLGAS